MRGYVGIRLRSSKRFLRPVNGARANREYERIPNSRCDRPIIGGRLTNSCGAPVAAIGRQCHSVSRGDAQWRSLITTDYFQGRNEGVSFLALETSALFSAQPCANSSTV